MRRRDVDCAPAGPVTAVELFFDVVFVFTLTLSASDLRRHGRHPEFGDVTLGQLIAYWVAHNLTHLGQVSEVLARHYRTDAGPWRAYMPALTRVALAE
jgi:hypothetical protein